MTGPIQRFFLMMLSCLVAMCLGSANSTRDKTKSSLAAKSEQIVVIVHKTDKGLLFEIESGEYKKGDANYLMAELKLHRGGERQIIELVDDRAPLSAIAEVSEMAINAGFRDIRPFVLWHKTGRMAQVLFGPAIKATDNPDKIEEREKKAEGKR